MTLHGKVEQCSVRLKNTVRAACVCSTPVDVIKLKGRNGDKRSQEEGKRMENDYTKTNFSRRWIPTLHFSLFDIVCFGVRFRNAADGNTSSVLNSEKGSIMCLRNTRTHVPDYRCRIRHSYKRRVTELTVMEFWVVNRDRVTPFKILDCECCNSEIL